MSEYGSNPPPRDPQNGGPGNSDRPGENRPDEPSGQPPYGQPAGDQYGQPQYGQPTGGQYGQPPEYGSPEQQYGLGSQNPGQYGQGQYGQAPYGQNPYGQPGGYGAAPYGQQPAYGQFGQYGSPMSGPNSNIPANVEFATMGRRLGAFLIDGVIITLAMIILLVAVFGVIAGSGTDLDDPNAVDDAVAGGAYLGFYAIAFVLALGYQVGLVALRGATVGKMVLGIRIVRTDNGQVPGWGSAILRWLIPFIGSFVCGVGQIVVYLSPFFDSSGRRQGWHDMAAKTVVIRV